MKRPQAKTGIVTVPVQKVSGQAAERHTDQLSIEEPLEIRLHADSAGRRTTMPVAVTMRTPGHDEELAAGFLFTEGIVGEPPEIEQVSRVEPNVIAVTLRNGVAIDPSLLDRHSFVTSSCGVCGKRSIAAIQVRRRHAIAPREPRVPIGIIHALPATLRAAQPDFARTGGIHAAGLFDAAGNLLLLREDVGRHNALDKLIGARFISGQVPMTGGIILVSGRASFELVQKAAMTGAPVLAAVGAPSSLAVQFAGECGMTLLGFVRDDRCNIYTHPERITGLPDGTA